jgi:hypothetical protein
MSSQPTSIHPEESIKKQILQAALPAGGSLFTLILLLMISHFT